MTVQQFQQIRGLLQNIRDAANQACNKLDDAPKLVQYSAQAQLPNVWQAVYVHVTKMRAQVVALQEYQDNM
jgi:hypothetical protein